MIITPLIVANRNLVMLFQLLAKGRLKLSTRNNIEQNDQLNSSCNHKSKYRYEPFQLSKRRRKRWEKMKKFYFELCN